MAHALSFYGEITVRLVKQTTISIHLQINALHVYKITTLPQDLLLYLTAYTTAASSLVVVLVLTPQAAVFAHRIII
jgi:hypothetical protein